MSDYNSELEIRSFKILLGYYRQDAKSGAEYKRGHVKYFALVRSVEDKMSSSVKTCSVAECSSVLVRGTVLKSQ